MLGAEELEAIDEFHRYLDTDGDGIPYRTLPGVHPKGAYFTRGSGHDQYGRYTEDEEGYTQVMERLARKIQNAGAALPEPVLRRSTDGEPAKLGLVALGGVDRAVLEAQEMLSDLGVETDYLRVRAYPFHGSLREFLESHERTFVIEQNRDAQLRNLLITEVPFPGDRLISVRRYGGLPLSATDVVEQVRELLGAVSGAPASVSASLA